jgi:tetratricopeptide (TPR) repeat protein
MGSFHSSRPVSRVVALVAVLLVASVAFAGVADAKKKKKEKPKQFTMTEAVAKKLTVAQEAIAEEQLAIAIEALAPLEKKADKGRLSEHERAQVYRFLSIIAVSQERYDDSLAYMQKALDQDALPETTTLGLMYNVAQIYLAIEKYPEAVSALKRWFRATDKRTSQAYYLLAVAYYQQSKYDKALRPAKKAVDIAEKPTQSWLQLLVALYLQEDKYAEAAPHVETLVTHFPKKSYYTQLAAIYNQLGEEQKALAVNQLAYEQGFLTDDRELRRLGEMFLFHGMPYRAAQVIGKAIEEGKVQPTAESLELLANSWLLAREPDRAVEPLMKAAELAETGEIYVRLGQVYLEREDWEPAAQALAKGLDRGVDKAGNAHLLLGITYYNQKKLKSARRAFLDARNFEKSRDPADQWIQMLDRDEKRAADAPQGA